MATCKNQYQLGGRLNPISRCSSKETNAGECVLVSFPDPTYCEGVRYEKIYRPTQEEIDSYPDREWLEKIGDVLFDTVFGVFDTAISAATDGIVDQWLTFEGDGEELLAHTIDNVNDAAMKLAGEIGTDISGLISTVVNQSASAMGEFLGVAKAQERVADGVVSSVEYLLEQGEWAAATRIREEQEAVLAAAEAAASQVRFDAFVEAQTAGLFVDAAENFSDVASINVFEEAEKMLGFTFNVFEENKSIMFDLARLHGINVAASFTDTADREIAAVNEVLLEGVLKPMAMTESYYTAIKAAMTITSDELMQTTLEQALVQAQLAGDIIGHEMDLIDYLKQRIAGE